jgi:hypothetical protein
VRPVRPHSMLIQVATRPSLQSTTAASEQPDLDPKRPSMEGRLGIGPAPRPRMRPARRVRLAVPPKARAAINPGVHPGVQAGVDSEVAFGVPLAASLGCHWGPVPLMRDVPHGASLESPLGSSLW